MSQIVDSFSGIVINQNGAYASTATTAVQTFNLPSDYVRGLDTIPNLTGLHIYANAAALSDSLTWLLEVNTGSWVTVASGTQIPQRVNWAWMRVMFTDPIPVDPTWLGAQFRITLGVTGGLTIGFSAGPTLMYRVLADVADSGTDFLGNVYRSAVIEAVIDNVSTFQSQAVLSSWISNPCPSQFGVESIYIDIRQGIQPVVIDRLTVDPMTPGVYFHLYYSNDPTGPGQDISSWENLLWMPIYKTFQATRMQTFALPEPITAKYLCIEFTNLQARSYNPGNFQLPTTYKKYPKWVLDYFIILWQGQEIDRLSSAVNVTYDALDLGYSYYTKDILQEPEPPLQAGAPVSSLSPFYQPPTSLDATTLGKISTTFQPYQLPPALKGDQDIISVYASNTGTSNYPTEQINAAVGNTTQVSNFEREALLLEKSFPIMFFYLPCRHSFRIAQASFQTNVAYFAGVKQLIFHRDVYTNLADTPQYNENLGDGTNLYLNDWQDPQALPPPPVLGPLILTPTIPLTPA